MDFQTANRLEPILLQFEDAWRNDSIPPRLATFLATQSRQQKLTDRDTVAVLLELSMIDLEHRLRDSQSVNADRYFEEFPELHDDGLSRLALLEFEIRIRSRLDQKPLSSELRYRHPDLKELQTISDSGIEQNETPLIPGATIGEFVIRRHIGSGSFSDVYLADDERLKRKVALKFLKPWMLSSANLKARMLREAQAVASLQHPNVVPVFEIGQHDNREFIASQFVEGPTLADWCHSHAPDPRRGARMIAQLAVALDTAHSNGIVHRDVKPENVIVAQQDQPMLLDFGLAHFGNATSELTVEGEIVGTPAYMSPEQAAGIREVGPSSDIYSLGVMLYQLVTGRLPFEGRPSAVLQQTIHSEPDPPNRVNASVPHDLQTICLKALAKSPNDRFASAQQLADDLRRFLRGEPILARPLGLSERCRRIMTKYPIATALAFLLMVGLAGAIGGIIQYQNVVRERNRATAAKEESRALHARDAAISGQIAQRRGQTRVAVERFREALARGHLDTKEILVSIAECELANGEFLESVDTLNVLRQSRLPPEDEARTQLVELQLALSGHLVLTTELDEFADSISIMELRDTDQHLLLGLQATNTAASLREFHRAYELDSHNVAARRLAALMAFLLADFDRSLQICETSQQLFDDRPEFQLLRAMNLSAIGESFAAEGLISDARISEEQRQQWSALCVFVNQSCRRFDTGASRVFKNDDRQESELDLEQLVDVLKTVKTSHSELSLRNQWYLPPRVARAFGQFLKEATTQNETNAATGLLESFSSVFSDKAGRHTRATRQLATAHPESTLKTTLARDALDRWGTSTENLTYVKQLFEDSIDAHSFVVGTRNQAKVGAFLAALGLARVQHVNQVGNSERAHQLLTIIDPAPIHDAELLRVLSLTPLQTQDSWDLAAKFIDRWVDVAAAEDQHPTYLEALWTQAVLHKNQQNWFRVLSDCDLIINTFPVDEVKPPVDPKGLKVTAVIEMIMAVKDEGARPDWLDILMESIRRRQWALSDAALEEMDAMVDSEQANTAVVKQLRKLKDAAEDDNWEQAGVELAALQQMAPEMYEELNLLKQTFGSGPAAP